MFSVKLLSIVVAVCVVGRGLAQTTTTSSPSTDPCSLHDGPDCEPCIKARFNNTGTFPTVCFYCGAEQKCKQFTENTVFPFGGLPCPNLEYNVGTCALTALIIAILIALFLLLVVVITCCVCCCCCIWCARRRKTKRMIEENRYLEEKDSIRQRSAERRNERKAKHDGIRRKYGLYKDGQEGNYKRLES